MMGKSKAEAKLKIRRRAKRMGDVLNDRFSCVWERTSIVEAVRDSGHRTITYASVKAIRLMLQKKKASL